MGARCWCCAGATGTVDGAVIGADDVLSLLMAQVLVLVQCWDCWCSVGIAGAVLGLPVLLLVLVLVRCWCCQCC